MVKKKGFALILLIVVIVTITTYLIFISPLKQNVKPYKTANKAVGNNGTFAISGIVWTNGLVKEEKETLGIDSDYQIEKPLPPLSQQGWPETTDGAFLIKNSFDFSDYLGKCVSVSGKIKEGWENLQGSNYEINGKWTFNRSAVVVDSMETISFEECFIKDQAEKGNEEYVTIEYRTVKGKLSFGVRPAPDINYDFIITPDEPFIDSQNPSGQRIPTKNLDISPSSDDIFLLILNNIGKKVEISGYMQWGYMESRFLRVEKILIL